MAEDNPGTARSILSPREDELREKRTKNMFLILALVLVLLWIGGFMMFHVAGFLIHLLLILAVVSIIFHFLRGRSA
ncbi:lmo0937 family membrane protein [Silvibacterium dinghuense]|nr:lmo0937 family membrane protein [Silvibacterium dinghuense]